MARKCQKNSSASDNDQHHTGNAGRFGQRLDKPKQGDIAPCGGDDQCSHGAHGTGFRGGEDTQEESSHHHGKKNQGFHQAGQGRKLFFDRCFGTSRRQFGLQGGPEYYGQDKKGP